MNLCIRARGLVCVALDAHCLSFGWRVTIVRAAAILYSHFDVPNQHDA